jgi:hypothetical protein
MSWRGNLSSHVERYQRDVRYSSSLRFNDESSIVGIEPLLNEIGNRDVVVDACLPPQLANDLRRNNVNAIWVPAILGDGASDGEIERQLLAGRWDRRWGGGDHREKVLLTRDVEFYKRIRGRAILISYRVSNSASRRFTSNAMMKRHLKRMLQYENFGPV